MFPALIGIFKSFLESVEELMVCLETKNPDPGH
jgi:hypothetical protein